MLESYFYKKTPKNLSTLKSSLILIPAKLFNPSSSLPPLIGFVNLRKNNSALINRKEFEKLQKRRLGGGGMEGGGVREERREGGGGMGRQVGWKKGGVRREVGEQGGGGEGGVGGQGRRWGGGWGGGEGEGEGKKKREDVKVSFHVESKQCNVGWRNSRQKLNSDQL